jgi:hypothetical protein
MIQCHLIRQHTNISQHHCQFAIYQLHPSPSSIVSPVTLPITPCLRRFCNYVKESLGIGQDSKRDNFSKYFLQVILNRKPLIETFRKCNGLCGENRSCNSFAFRRLKCKGRASILIIHPKSYVAHLRGHILGHSLVVGKRDITKDANRL